MATFYYKLITNSFFCNKKILIIAYIIFFIVFLILLFIGGKEIENKIVLLIFMSTCIFGAYKTYKINDFNYLTYNLDSKLYDYYSLKKNKICYKETFNKLLLHKIESDELDIDSTKKIDNFLLSFNNEFISRLKDNITFERFNDYFIKSKGNGTTGQLFYVQYRSSLVKIIKDFIIDTNELKDISNETISSFMYELTNRNNLFFDSNNGLHYNDKFVLEFLEKNNNQKTIIQENVTISENEQLKIKDISIFNFYRILSNSIKDVCNLKLNRKENREIKSFVGLYFKSDEEGTITFEKEFQKLSFTNEGNYKNFILILKYLTELHYVEIHESKLSRILKRCISEISFPNEVKDRTESIRQYYRNTDLSNIQKEKINSILQSFLNNKA